MLASSEWQMDATKNKKTTDIFKKKSVTIYALSETYLTFFSISEAKKGRGRSIVFARKNPQRGGSRRAPNYII